MEQERIDEIANLNEFLADTVEGLVSTILGTSGRPVSGVEAGLAYSGLALHFIQLAMAQ